MPTTQAQIDAAMELVDNAYPDIAKVLRKLPIKVGPLDYGTLADYDAEHKKLTINESFNLDVEDVAANLIHEGTHALDDTLGKLDDNDHLPSEKRAKLNEIKFVLARYPNGKTGANIYDRDINGWIKEYRKGTLDDALAVTYSEEASMIRTLFGI